ncbi:unnamed protein product, partial [Urochloa humidicola]
DIFPATRPRIPPLYIQPGHLRRFPSFVAIAITISPPPISGTCRTADALAPPREDYTRGEIEGRRSKRPEIFHRLVLFGYEQPVGSSAPPQAKRSMSGAQGRRMQPPARSSSYYAVLGVHPAASAAEIRAAYHRLAMRWHPDKVASGRASADPARAEEAKARFQQIHEAYQVLSDEKRRALYDAGMYDPLDDDQEDVEGFHDFLQEMISLMATVGREPVYSLGELQSMLDGMIQDFAAPQHEPTGFVFAGGAASPFAEPNAAGQSRSSPSARMHPQGIGDSACFSRTAFSR